MTNVSNKHPVKSRPIWADLDAISKEINAQGLILDPFGISAFEGSLFELWIERPMRYGSSKTVHIYLKEAGMLIPRACRLWIYFFGDDEVSLAVLAPWDQQTSFGRRMDIESKDPMNIWTTVVHNPVHCRCNNAKQFQPDWSE